MVTCCRIPFFLPRWLFFLADRTLIALSIKARSVSLSSCGLCPLRPFPVLAKQSSESFIVGSPSYCKPSKWMSARKEASDTGPFSVKVSSQ